MQAKAYKWRIRFVLLVLVLLFSLLLLRVLWLHLFLQIPNRYNALRSNTERGSIVDANGFPLALSQEVSSIGINPSHIENRKLFKQKLLEIGHLSEKEIDELLQSSRFQWIARKANKKLLRLYQKSGLKKLTYIKEYKRIYPDDSLFSHVLGFVDLDNQGREGIEASFNNYLSGNYIPLEDDKFLAKHFYHGVHGYTIRLTLDRMIQYILDKEIKAAYEKNRAKSAFGIVMETDTGRILGMASYPNFNPNDIANSRSENRRNRCITDSFEPGSTFKIFIASALFEEGVVNEEDTFYCPSFIMAKDKKINCTGKHGHLNFTQVIQKSCNVGIIKAAQKININRLYYFLKQLGFGEKTGIPLTGEQSGIFRSPDKWSFLSPYSISIGYEVSVTGLQIIRAASTIANGGYLITPRIIESIETPDHKKIHYRLSVKKKKILSTRTAERIMKLLHLVTQKGGTGYLASPRGLQVAGKTGTAQKSEAGKGYIDGKYIASFIGFLPYEQPRYSILVVINEPSGAYWGGSIATPVFRRIAEQLKHQLGIIKSVSYEKLRQQKILVEQLPTLKDKDVLPDFRGLSFRDALYLARELEEGGVYSFSFSGSGHVYDQSIIKTNEDSGNSDRQKKIRIRLLLK